MKAAILHGAHDFRIEDREIPIISEDELLMDVKACGICHSELDQWDKNNPSLEYPRFIGHEVSGVVEEAGKNSVNFKLGDRVSIWVDGQGYAEKVKVRADRAFKISDKILFEEAMAEPISCTTNAILKTNIQSGDDVVIVGTGFMGLMLLQQLRLYGVDRIIAVDIRDEMLEIARQLGADVTINPKSKNLEDEINLLTNKKGVDVSFEVGGNQSTLDIPPQITRMEGKIVIVGYHPGKRVIQDLGWWNWMAFDIVNAHFRDLNTILKGAELGIKQVNSNKVNMKPLITHKYNLDEIEEGFTAAKTKPDGFVKAVITID